MPRLTSAVGRFLFVWHLGRKISRRPSYPARCLDSERAADHRAAPQTQPVKFGVTAAIRTRLARMCRAAHTHTPTRASARSFFFASETFSQFPAPLLPLLLMPPGSADDLSQLSPPASLLTSPAPALTTSTKLTSQACSAESVGGVRCCHLPPPPLPPPPLHWAPFQDQTACSLTHSLTLPPPRIRPPLPPP